MDAPAAVPDDHGIAGSLRSADRKSSPVAFALDRLFPKRGRAPYAATERLVVLVIVRAMSFDAPAEAFNCFLSYPTIARWAGVSLASVKRALQQHIDGPAPLLARSKPGSHARVLPRVLPVHVWCGRLSTGERAGRRTGDADSRRSGLELRDLQPDRIALQRQRRDFGGTLTGRGGTRGSSTSWNEP